MRIGMKRLAVIVMTPFILCMGFCCHVLADSGWLFASLLEQKKIVTFERNDKTGELIRKFEFECPAEPAFLAVSPNQHILLVSFRSTGQLASFRIGAGGELALLSVVDGGQDPAYLECDRTGRFVVSAYYVSNKVSVHQLNSDGTLSVDPVYSTPTAARAHGVAFDSKNRHVFVPHTGANRIYQFHFDVSTGRLRANEPPYLETPKSFHPRHVMIHPTDRWMYASHEAGDSIGVYSVNQESGTLTLMQQLSSIPDEFDGALNSTARCEMTRDGRFVYVANRGHDSVACFAINQESGRVRSLGQVATESVPRSLSIDSSTRYVYVAGQATGKIACYRINHDGRLSRVATYVAGPVAWCVIAVDKKSTKQLSR